jgi:hypothetical protein
MSKVRGGQAYKILVGKYVKKPLGTSRRRWNDNIKMNPKK